MMGKSVRNNNNYYYFIQK